MNVGKVKKVEAISGYKLNRKQVGCKYHPWCFDCPFPDCIRGQNYDKEKMTKHGQQLIQKRLETQIKKAQAMSGFGDHFEEACGKYKGKEKER